MTAQTLPALLTNDPKQRPTVGVWQTVFNYIVPMAFTIILNTVLLPKYGQIAVTETGYAVDYSQAYLTAAAAVGTPRLVRSLASSLRDQPLRYLRKISRTTWASGS